MASGGGSKDNPIVLVSPLKLPGEPHLATARAAVVPEMATANSIV